MLHLFREAGMPRRAPPKLHTDCSNAYHQILDDKPQITSPLRGVTYTIRLKKPETIVPKTSHGGQSPIYWFADNEFIAKSEAGSGVAWSPQKTGHYVLCAVDDAGQSDSREVEVEFIN
ncbi:MAG: hypothetical protein Q8M99_03840 [Methylotenera sp.]|nr:hypothetical protein [Methylotenera sp.]